MNLPSTSVLSRIAGDTHVLYLSKIVLAAFLLYAFAPLRLGLKKISIEKPSYQNCAFAWGKKDRLGHSASCLMLVPDRTLDRSSGRSDTRSLFPAVNLFARDGVVAWRD